MTRPDFHITAAAIVEDKGRYLMVREERGEGRIRLNQPAGHLEANETLPQAAFREALEETAWRVEITDYLGLYICQYQLGGAVYLRHAFAAKPLGHDPVMRLDKGVLEALWLTADEIKAREAEHLSPMVMQCVLDHRAGKRLPLDAITQFPWPLQRG